MNLFAVLVLGVLAVNAYRQPLGPRLEPPAAVPLASAVPTAAAAAIPTAAVSAIPTAVSQALPTAIPTAAASAIPTAVSQVLPTATTPAKQAAACGETGAWNMVILGSDAAELRGPKGSDLTRVMRLDFSNGKVNIYALPRDLWSATTTVGLTKPKIEAAQLGQVFYEARMRSTQTDKRLQMVDATNASAKTLLETFNLRFDHYLTVDLSQIPAMIDTIGGVPMNIPERTTDRWIGMVIEAGPQTLTGTQVQAYARAKPDSDFARIQRNNLLLEAVRQKLVDPLVWVKIPQVYDQVKGAIVTDLSPEQIVHLTCFLKSIPREAIVQDSVKPEWTTPGPDESLLWDKAKVFSRLRELGLIQ
jgi:LCP family protein required for cell wall assembly